MIGKSGQYYRAGYLCRMAGDWPDAPTTGPESSDSGQTDDQQQGTQPVKYDGSQNPNQSINVTAAPNLPMPLSDSPPLNATVGPETGSPLSASQQGSSRALAGSAYPGVSGESFAGTRSGMASGAKPVQSAGFNSNRQQPSQGGANRLQGAAPAFVVDPQREQMLNYIADCEGHAKHDGKGAERGWGAYDDSKNYCTTGYGQLLHQSFCTPDDYSRYQGETEAQARARLGQDYDKFYRDIHSRIPNANMGQTHSFVDQAFNMGVDDPTHQHGVINH
jgi:hypothetical protein